jgi:hypothetical protein
MILLSLVLDANFGNHKKEMEIKGWDHPDNNMGSRLHFNWRVLTNFYNKTQCEGKFWIRRFRDAWDSCSHKKAVALGIFSLVWNLSSMVARIWAGKGTPCILFE